LRSSGLALLWIAAAFGDVTAIREMIRAGRFAEAAAACDVDLRKAPPNAALLTLKGLALRGAGDAPGALAALRGALRLSPAYWPALQAAAQLEFEARDPRARTTLETILRMEPANAVAHAMLAELAFEASDWGRVLTHADRAEKSPLAQWRRGVALFGLERYSEAAREFAALVAVREHGPTRFNLALAHWRAGNAPAALAALGPLDDADAESLRAAALRATREVPKALAVLQSAVERYPRDERLLLELALLCLDQNAIELGIRVLEAGAANHPAPARLLTALGVFRVRSGETEKGEALFAQARKLAPESGLGEVATATTLMQLGMADEAVRVLRKLPVREPMAALTLARALLMRDENAEAKPLLRAVIAREPGNAAARSLLGKALASEGAVRPAVSELEAALRLDANDRGTVYQLMGLYKRLGRPSDSARMAARLRELMAREKAVDAEAQRYQLSLSPANER